MNRISIQKLWKLGRIDKIRNKEWERYKKRKASRLSNRNFTIIASSCTGTVMYFDLGLPYLSPTVNLLIEQHDFVKMVENLEWYMNSQIVELYGDEDYPTGLLNDIKIHFKHYDSFDQAVSKWEKRKKRINWDNLFIIGTSYNGDYGVIQRFDKLPYKNKVIFSPVRYPEFKSVYYVKAFKEKWGVTTDFKNQFLMRRYLDDFDYVAFLNGTPRCGKA